MRKSIRARAACGQDQRPDHALQGVAAVENGQVLALDDAGLLAEQLDGQFTFGPEFHDAVGPDWQLRQPEVEPAGVINHGHRPWY